MSVNQNCNIANFYIMAVIKYIYTGYVVFDVICNCGSSRFVPMHGDKLPKMVVDFMAEHEVDAVKYSSLCTVYFAEVPV